MSTNNNKGNKIEKCCNTFQTLEKIQSQVFHIKCNNQLSDSIVNYFTLAIGFFMFGCIYAEIIFSENIKYYFYGNLIIAGIAQSLLGIYDWHKGKSLSVLINISFGLLFISWFIKYILLENGEIEKDDNIYEGALYIIWCLLTVVIIIAVKNKGVLYSLDYLAVTVGFVFMIVDKYGHQNWIKKTYGYTFIVAGGLFWITGLLRLMNTTLFKNTVKLVKE